MIMWFIKLKEKAIFARGVTKNCWLVASSRADLYVLKNCPSCFENVKYVVQNWSILAYDLLKFPEKL